LTGNTPGLPALEFHLFRFHGNEKQVSEKQERLHHRCSTQTGLLDVDVSVVLAAALFCLATGSHL